MASFKDNFSKQSDLYMKYRPHYPVELYQFLASLTEDHDLAWDCGTGNGQAAVGLAAFYNKVIATDPSEQQIRNCLPHEKIDYRLEKAENNSIKPDTVDLLSIANALHWFDFDTFYAEVRRVLKNNGIIAAWAYGYPTVTPEVDVIIQDYHNHTLNDYWLPENRYSEEEYRTIPFPFQQISCPVFFSEKMMTAGDFVGFLNTWSATQRFIDKNNYNPTDELKNDLVAAWKGNDSEKKVTWKLSLKAGRVRLRN
jgi:SAM-dependent methyltransferase